MYIYLPNAKDGLESLVERMTSEHGFLDKYVPSKYVTLGEFKITKFKISYELELSEDLKNMGLELPFRQRYDGDGDKPVDCRDLFVRGLHPNSFIEVNEDGTDAAFDSCSRLAKDLGFVADHPFAFVIRENRTNIVLSVGSVVNVVWQNS